MTRTPCIVGIRQTPGRTMERSDAEGVREWGRVGNEVHQRRQLLARQVTGTASHRA